MGLTPSRPTGPSRQQEPPRQWDPAALVVAAGTDAATIARRLGVTPAVLCRPLSDRQADRYAVALGLLPWMVWGMEWLDDRPRQWPLQ